MRRCIHILLFICVLIFPNIAFANYYGIAQNFTTGLDGGFMRATLKKPLDSKWDILNRTRHIEHVLWLTTDSNGSWLEVGFTDGGIRQPGESDWSYYHGHYLAKGVRNINHDVTYYEERKIIGPSTNDGAIHTFQVQRDGYNTWGIYIDWTLRRTYTASISALRMDVGLETNYYYSNSAQWNERDFQFYQGGQWRYWSLMDSYRLLGGIPPSLQVSWQNEPRAIYTYKY